LLPTGTVNEIKRIVSSEFSGKLLYVTISGSHLYGFESHDSDIDFRGCWLIDTNKLLGLDIPKDHIERVQGENDIVLFELRKELNLLDKGNCNVLEHLFAKQLYTSDEYYKLKKIITLNLNISGIYNSYRGMAYANYHQFCLKGRHTVKKFLYVFRALLAGLHAIQLRNIEPNINILLSTRQTEPYYKPIMELIRLKKNGNEQDFLSDRMLPIYHKLVEDLMSELDQTYEESQPSDRIKRELDNSRKHELDKFLKKIRKQFISK
jgi:hypothetical protein